LLSSGLLDDLEHLGFGQFQLFRVGLDRVFDLGVLVFDEVLEVLVLLHVDQTVGLLVQLLETVHTRAHPLLLLLQPAYVLLTLRLFLREFLLGLLALALDRNLGRLALKLVETLLRLAHGRLGFELLGLSVLGGQSGYRVVDLIDLEESEVFGS